MNIIKKIVYYANFLKATLAFISTSILKKKRLGMESKTKNKKNRDQISAMVKRSFAGVDLAPEEDAIQELKEGWFNVAYLIRLADGREVILKIAPPQSAEVMSYEKNIMATEVASMRLAATNPAIPVPEIYFYDQTHELCDSDYFFMEKLSGENFEHLKNHLSKTEQAQINQHIGKIIYEINQFKGSFFGYDGNPDLRADNWKEAFVKIMDALLADGQMKNADLCFQNHEIRAAVERHAAVLEEVTTPVMVHWDAWDLNFFASDGKISGILDFERVLWADPLMEAQFRALMWGGVTDSLKAYGKTTFSHNEDIRNHLYTLHLALVMKIECYYRNYDTEEVCNMAKMMLLPAMKWLQEN